MSDQTSAGERHLMLVELAQVSSGRMAPEEITRTLVPHLEALSPQFRQQMAEIRRLMAEAGHWDALVAVTEWLEAPSLWAQVLGLPYAQQISTIDGDDRQRGDEQYHTWGLCRLLERLSAAVVPTDRRRAAQLANLSVRISRHLGETAYGPEWVRDLRALALGRLAEARRLLGELESAGDALDLAESERLRGTGGPRLEAELLSLRALLRRDQHRLAEAVQLLGRVIEIRCAASLGAIDDSGPGEPRPAGEAGVHLAWCTYHLGNPYAALGWLEDAERDLDCQREERLTLGLRCGRVWSALALGRIDAAAGALGAAAALAERLGATAERLRLRRAEARIALAGGERDAAAQALDATAGEFARLGLGIDAALSSFELAAMCLDGQAGPLAASAGREALQAAAAAARAALRAPDLGSRGVEVVLEFVEACPDGVTSERLQAWTAMLEQARRPCLSWWSASQTVLSPGVGNAR